jgi:hypothetical protein
MILEESFPFFKILTLHIEYNILQDEKHFKEYTKPNRLLALHA